MTVSIEHNPNVIVGNILETLSTFLRAQSDGPASDADFALHSLRHNLDYQFEMWQQPFNHSQEFRSGESGEAFCRLIAHNILIEFPTLVPEPTQITDLNPQLTQGQLTFTNHMYKGSADIYIRYEINTDIRQIDTLLEKIHNSSPSIKPVISINYRLWESETPIWSG